MAIYLGQPPDDRYTRVPNDWLRDPKIRGLAKAILAYFLSHRSGYALTIKQMAAEFKEGEDALYTAVKELIKAGYVQRTQRRSKGGVVGQVDFHVIGADGKFPQVDTASGFSGSGEPGSGPTCDDAEFSQVTTASGFSASGSTGSGESGTKKNMSKKTKVLEDQNNTTSPYPSVTPVDVADSDVSEEEGEQEISSKPEPQDHTATIADLIAPYAHQLAAGEQRRLSRRITEAINSGWRPDQIVRILAEDLTGLQSVAAGLIGRVADLGPTPYELPNAGPAPCPDCNDTGRKTIDTTWGLVDTDCGCEWERNPAEARRKFRANARLMEACEHGEGGGNIPAPDGWMICPICRRASGWTDTSAVAKRNDGSTQHAPVVNIHANRRSTGVLRAEQALRVADELDAEHGTYYATGEPA